MSISTFMANKWICHDHIQIVESAVICDTYNRCQLLHNTSSFSSSSTLSFIWMSLPVALKSHRVRHVFSSAIESNQFDVIMELWISITNPIWYATQWINIRMWRWTYYHTRIIHYVNTLEHVEYVCGSVNTNWCSMICAVSSAIHNNRMERRILSSTIFQTLISHSNFGWANIRSCRRVYPMLSN